LGLRVPCSGDSLAEVRLTDAAVLEQAGVSYRDRELGGGGKRHFACDLFVCGV